MGAEEPFNVQIQDIVREVFHRDLDETLIRPLKKGMTNDSFYLEVDGKSYVLRKNGIGTEELIDRQGEAAAYQTIAPFQIAEPLVAICPQKGYKVSEFLQNVHTCRAKDISDVRACMQKLRRLHSWSLPYRKPFDILQQIAFYEHLWKQTSRHEDYAEVKDAIFHLTPLHQLLERPLCLCHIDAVPANFLLSEDGRVYLIDWEYAAGCDPLMDPAMFSIYAGYSKEQSVHLLNVYLGRRATQEERFRYASYMAAGGLLWSNWCEYKEDLGETFGPYAAMQYGYANDCAAWAKEWEA